MVTLKPIYSKERPSIPYCLWLKPTAEGVESYVIDGGIVRPMKPESVATPSVLPSDVQAASAAVKDAIIGSASDAADALTLHGLKAYVTEQLAGLEGD